ncbi:MAG: VIT1/CCC1 transporter family protein [Nitrososphaeria archaeon]
MDIIAQFYRDEIHDMKLYTTLSKLVKDQRTKAKLIELANIERRHASFFQKILERLSIRVPDEPSSIMIFLESLILLLFSLKVTMKIFEEREAATVVNYLKLYEDSRLLPEEKETLKRVIEDEMEHEKFFGTTVSSAFLNNIRDILLGVNDGLIELLAAVSGFAGAYAVGLYVGIAGIVIGVSGSLSMAVGAYLSTKSENELARNLALRAKLSEIVFGSARQADRAAETAGESAFYVGISYLIGSLIPTLPYFLGLSIRYDQLVSYALTVVALIIIGYLASVTTGVDYRRKILEMVALALAASIVTFALGELIRVLLGIRAYALAA